MNYSKIEKDLQSHIDLVLQTSRANGADATEVSAGIDTGFSVQARNGDLETLEHHHQKYLNITVYFNQCSASTSTSDFSREALITATKKAATIAKHTQKDPFAGLAEAKEMAYDYKDLDLYHPWQLTPQAATQKLIECEKIAKQQDPRITECEGASLNTFDVISAYGNSHGFYAHVWKSIHDISCTLVAEENQQKQRDYEYTVNRNPKELLDIETLAKQAAINTVDRLGARKIKTQNCPVIFQAKAAKTLIKHFLSAISGGNLYRKSSFLLDQLGNPIFPEWVNIYQRPHEKGALGSVAFDGEGVRTRDLDYIKDGILTNYILSSYSARKLDMQTTGNAGGTHNLYIDHSQINLAKLLKKMDTGLFVTELMGQGVNLINGDYSRGITGFWVEKGEIQFPVEEVTIAGNLKQMFSNIVAIANDVDHRSNLHAGSILLDNMMIAGT